MELAYQGLFIRLPFEGAVGVEAFEMNASFNDHVTLRLLLLVEEEKIEALIHGIGDGRSISDILYHFYNPAQIFSLVKSIKSAENETFSSAPFSERNILMPKPRTSTGEKNLISKRLIKLREKHNMSQRLLAYQLQLNGYDMDKNVITRIETNKRYVTDVELKALSEIFHVSYDYLIDGKEDEI